ncbi:MAG TPA: hypothetical protein VF447_03665 [Terriglobales bacterium]
MPDDSTRGLPVQQRFEEVSSRLQLTAEEVAAILYGAVDYPSEPALSLVPVRMRQFADLAQSACILLGDWDQASAWLRIGHDTLSVAPLDAMTEDTTTLATLRAILLREVYEVAAIRSVFKP